MGCTYDCIGLKGVGKKCEVQAIYQTENRADLYKIIQDDPLEGLSVMVHEGGRTVESEISKYANSQEMDLWLFGECLEYVEISKDSTGPEQSGEQMD